MRVLVTGGSGVMGVRTITELLRRGHDVVLLTRHARSDARQWDAGVVPRPGDVTRPASIRGAAEQCDVVLHLVGIVGERDAATFDAVNVGGTANMLEEAARAGVRRFVYVSSLGATAGNSRYHRSKVRAEALTRAFPGEWVIVRPGNVYGPGDGQLSLLLRLVRGPSPIVPRVGDGRQPLQPIWWTDCAHALSIVVERADLAGRELDIAGSEVTSQNDLIARLGKVTGRRTRTLRVPESIVTISARLISRIGWSVPFNEDQLVMLREGSRIPPGEVNALQTILQVTPTPLDVGLRQLTDVQPEQLPSHGIGALKHKRYWADITGSDHDAASLFAHFTRHFDDVTPVYVGTTERHGPEGLVSGATLTLSLPMRGHVQVRVVEMDATHAIVVTLEGHPLAGAVRFSAQPRGATIRFEVEVFDRAANFVDLLAMRTIGDRLQDRSWMRVVTQMIARSRGEAPGGAQHDSVTLRDGEERRVEQWLEEVVLRFKRARNARRIAATS